ncbi:MAG: hypothetical protein ACOYD4_06840 [Solirubrobacterales bacterium]
MARYIVDLTELSSSSFASGDFMEVWHAAGGSNRSKKLRLDRFAMLTGAAFTGNVSTTGTFSTPSADLGNSNENLGLGIGRNSNASPAPGVIALSKSTGGTSLRLYFDDSDILRSRSGTVTNANFASGTVIGAQTSALDYKDVLGEPDRDGLWERITQGAASVRRFVYKAHVDADGYVGARPFGGEEFAGVVVDYAPHYGMDRDAEHPAGKALNEINILGDLLLAVDWLAGRIAG